MIRRNDSFEPGPGDASTPWVEPHHPTGSVGPIGWDPSLRERPPAALWPAFERQRQMARLTIDYKAAGRRRSVQAVWAVVALIWLTAFFAVAALTALAVMPPQWAVPLVGEPWLMLAAACCVIAAGLAAFALATRGGVER